MFHFHKIWNKIKSQFCIARMHTYNSPIINTDSVFSISHCIFDVVIDLSYRLGGAVCQCVHTDTNYLWYVWKNEGAVTGLPVGLCLNEVYFKCWCMQQATFPHLALAYFQLYPVFLLSLNLEFMQEVKPRSQNEFQHMSAHVHFNGRKLLLFG